MVKKELYLVPAMDVISLAGMKETMQASSPNGTGTDMADPNIIGGSWDDIFTVL